MATYRRKVGYEEFRGLHHYRANWYIASPFPGGMCEGLE
jgi:hypothetical protein